MRNRTFTLKSHTQNHDEDRITELVPIDTSLDRINSNGKIIGPRGSAAPQRIKPSLAGHALYSPDTIANSTGFVYTEEYADTINDSDRPHEEQRISGISAFGDCLEPSMADKLPTDNPITTLVLDLEHVLSTNADAVRGKSENGLLGVDHIRKQLCFGGEQRIEAIKVFMERVHERNEWTKEAQKTVKCFIVCDEWSKMVLQLLMDIGLVSYFMSRFRFEMVSHVVGRDHAMAINADHKKHLILLDLLDTLGRTHDEMLFIGANEQEIDHLRSIGLCRTSFCETQGLTEEAMESIASTFF